MIGWLQGEVRHRFRRGNRHLILLACDAVGYEVQLVQRDWHQVQAGDQEERWIHQAISADNIQLFGFQSVQDRDLFRDLISVNGVGPQAGLALLDVCSGEELVSAVIHGELSTLTRAQGVGKRTAERLALELRPLLAAQLNQVDNDQVHNSSALSRLDLITTLEALGYETMEIRAALQKLKALKAVNEGEDDEAWLRACIRLMSGGDG
ncbi:MAG: Holliday junction branch migration protein RuvA [Cyanobacteriota bacterium]|nr:Holliday junction branch migration protein RuvA [Cyanobacteriota bacterium]